MSEALSYLVGVLLATVIWLWLTRREQQQRADRLLRQMDRLDLLRHDVAALHAGHLAGRCAECDKPWPCPTRRLTDRSRLEARRRE